MGRKWKLQCSSNYKKKKIVNSSIIVTSGRARQSFCWPWPRECTCSSPWPSGSWHRPARLPDRPSWAAGSWHAIRTRGKRVSGWTNLARVDDEVITKGENESRYYNNTYEPHDVRLTRGREKNNNNNNKRTNTTHNLGHGDRQPRLGGNHYHLEGFIVVAFVIMTAAAAAAAILQT